jgi:hypothetical protein
MISAKCAESVICLSAKSHYHPPAKFPTLHGTATLPPTRARSTRPQDGKISPGPADANSPSQAPAHRGGRQPPPSSLTQTPPSPASPRDCAGAGAAPAPCTPARSSPSPRPPRWTATSPRRSAPRAPPNCASRSSLSRRRRRQPPGPQGRVSAPETAAGPGGPSSVPPSRPPDLPPTRPSGCPPPPGPAPCSGVSSFPPPYGPGAARPWLRRIGATHPPQGGVR